MTLTWTEPQRPNEDSHYDHVIAETPLGQIKLEWKSWKDYDAPGGQMPWDEFAVGADLEKAKADVQAKWNEKILLAMLLVDKG